MCKGTEGPSRTTAALLHVVALGGLIDLEREREREREREIERARERQRENNKALRDVYVFQMFAFWPTLHLQSLSVGSPEDSLGSPQVSSDAWLELRLGGWVLIRVEAGQISGSGGNR